MHPFLGTTVSGWRLAALTGLMLAVSLSHAQAPRFEGTWSGVFTTQEDEFWQVEDYACFTGCLPEGYEYLAALLDDPANDERAFDELMGQAFAFMQEQMREKLTPEGRALQDAVTPANDSALYCHPYDFAREITNPLPMVIRREGQNLVIDYEEWSLSRTIHMDGRNHPENLLPTPLGHSIGRYEDGALVVETVGLSAASFFLHLGGGGYTEQARGLERYTIAEHPRRLDLELTIEDPVMLREPYVVVKTWLYTPDVELVEDSCEDFPAQPDFDAVATP